MRTLIGAAAVWLLCVSVVSPGQAEEFTGGGPLPVRNFQPIQLIFLNLPFERAQVLAPAEFELHLDSAESNEIATNQEDVQALLKFETNRTVLGGSVGVMRGLEVGLDVPFISRFGGFLDPFVDAVEDLFHTSNPERKLFPHNTFGGFHVERGGVVLFDGPKEQFEIGDVWASAKYLAWQPEGFPQVALRGAVKFPTGRASAVFGSGKPDFGLGLAAEQQFLPWLIAYGNLDVVYPVGPITPDRRTLNPILQEGVAGEAQIMRRVSVLLQQETYTSPIHGTKTRLLDGTVVELAGGFNVVYDPVLFQIGVIDNISPVATAADLTVLVRLTYRR